jgi:hypothetical protein
MTNVRAGVDTLLCRTFASNVNNGPNVVQLGGPVTVLRKVLVTDPSRTSTAAKDALVKQLEAHTHIRFMAIDKIEMWDVELSGNADSWNTHANPALMCDIERYVARGSIIRNNSFHHTTCNMGRTKSSDSVIENNIFEHARSANLEITGLEQWMEGPMAINNVSVMNNNFVGTAEGDRNVHPSTQATNITLESNLPHKAAPPLDTRITFCPVGNESACRAALQGAKQDFKCSADYEHVERQALPPHTIHVDALHVDVQGNGHTDVSVRGVIYSDDDGRPGQLLATSIPTLVKAHAARSFVRLPFSCTGGIAIRPRSKGDSVWTGEQAGKPAGGGSTVSVAVTGNATDPPGPSDLACFGFTPPFTGGRQPCQYTPQPFAQDPKSLFGTSFTCSSSLNIYATTIQTAA